MRSSISLLIWGLTSPPPTLLLGGAGTGGTGLDRRSEFIRLGKGFGGLSGASTDSVNTEQGESTFETLTVFNYDMKNFSELICS